MYPYVTRALLVFVCNGMYPCVTRMLPVCPRVGVLVQIQSFAIDATCYRGYSTCCVSSAKRYFGETPTKSRTRLGITAS